MRRMCACLLFMCVTAQSSPPPPPVSPVPSPPPPLPPPSPSTPPPSTPFPSTPPPPPPPTPSPPPPRPFAPGALDETFWTVQRIIIVSSCISMVFISFAFFVCVACRSPPLTVTQNTLAPEYKKPSGTGASKSATQRIAKEVGTFAVISARS